MKKLIITELARAVRFGGKAMAQVRGGWSLNPPGYDDGYSPPDGLPIHADPGDRNIAYVENPTGNDLPGPDRVRECTTIWQSGQFKISVS